MRRFTPRSIRSIPCFVNTASRDRRPLPYYIGFARSANVCFCNRLRRDPSAPLPSIHLNQVIVITSVPLLTPTTQLPQSTPGSFLFLHNHRTTIAAYITSRPPPHLRFFLHPWMALKSEAWLVLVTFRTLSSSMKYRCFLFVTGYIQTYQCRESLPCGFYPKCNPGFDAFRIVCAT